MTANALPTQANEEQSDLFLPISPMLLIPATLAEFSVYIRQNKKFVLYANGGDNFTEAHRERLIDMGIKQVFVCTYQRSEYIQYLQKYIGDLLGDEGVPVEERCAVWRQVMTMQMQTFFKEQLPKSRFKSHFMSLQTVVRASMQFLSSPEALRQVARFLSRGFTVYEHCVGSMVLMMSVLQTYPEYEKDESFLVKCCLGALLHDIGKTRLPKELVEKNLENLSKADFEILKGHTALGVAMCANLPLSQETLNCILMHHEQANGQGYPTNMSGDEIPLYVRALSLCNMYDNLTRASALGPPRTPFEALKAIKAMKDAYDLDMLKRLIMVLSNAKIM